MTRACVDCGADITDRPANAYLCANCRHRRQLAHSRKWRSRHPIMKTNAGRRSGLGGLGKRFTCTICGEERIKTGPGQKHCRRCAREAHQAVCLAYVRAKAAA